MSLKQKKMYTNVEEIEVLAVGFSSEKRQDVELGPAALLGAGIVECLEDVLPDACIYHDGIIHTYSDAFEPALVEGSEHFSKTSSESSIFTYLNQPFEISHATECLAGQVYRRVRQKRTTLTLGCDHSIAIGTISGSAKACQEIYGQSLGVIWIDAAPNINSPDFSSGNIWDMPLSFLTGLTKTAPTEPFGWLDDMPSISLSKLVYIGLRDISPAEQKILKQYGIFSVSADDIQKLGVKSVMQKVFTYLGERPLHVSVEVDALNLDGSGGMEVAEAIEVCSTIRSEGNMVSMDLAVKPSVESMSDARDVVDTSIALVESAFGILWRL